MNFSGRIEKEYNTGFYVEVDPGFKFTQGTQDW